MLEARLPRLEQQMLWQHVLGVARSWLIAHDTDPLPEQAVSDYRHLEARRLAGEPMAYILGEREFMGYMFHVSPDVLIPRPDTETLVVQVLEDTAGYAAPRILDLGTGSGAIAISLALQRPDAVVTATDVSQAALAIARRNAHHLQAINVQCMQGSWYQALPTQAVFDVIVSNPPYIHATDPHLQQGDVRFEPRTALTDGADGLSDIRHIVAGAVAHLASYGAVYIEHGWDQARAVRDIFTAHGFTDVRSVCDLAGIERVTVGHRVIS